MSSTTPPPPPVCGGPPSDEDGPPSDADRAVLRHPSLVAAAEWSSHDPNVRTRALILRSIRECSTQRTATEELMRYFPPEGGRIRFGTAGLRGRMMPGPVGMNDLVVIQTTQGLARYVLEKWGGKGDERKPPLAVVGYDHRRESEHEIESRTLAMLTKLVFLECGMECVLLDANGVGGGGGGGDCDGRRRGYEFVHTPLVAFATKHLRAAVGVMITASHNPKCDNGYKVYWSDGVQIRSPLDSDISSCISRAENLAPWTDYGAKLRRRRRGSHDETEDDVDSRCDGPPPPCLGDPDRTEEVASAYYDAIRTSGLVTGKGDLMGGGRGRGRGGRRPRIAYTPLHGVGLPWARRAFQTFGLDPFLSVPTQEDPDPDFTTVPFPNPEEAGALDEAIKFAESVENDCDVILANDPDADRMAVAERSRDGDGDGDGDGGWTVFTGDQIGAILGRRLWEKVGRDSDAPIAMVASAVSSTMLSSIAAAEGFRFEETLTGFKWIGSQMLRLQSEGYRPLFGYEEAIGYAFGDVTCDKDGVVAMGVITDLLYELYGEGTSLAQHLGGLYGKYGTFVSRNGYYGVQDPSGVSAIFDKMRDGGTYPTSVGGYAVESVRYLGEPGYDSSTPDGRPALPTSASSPMITLRFANGTTAHFRGSGTEPKFKYYVEMRGGGGVGREEVERELDEMMGVILEELLEPGKNGLSRL